MTNHRIAPLVERVIHEWEAKQRTAELEGHAPFKPVITISRSKGAGGTAVAEAVAERLGFRVYDRELVEQIARNAKVMQAIVQTVDERTRSAIENGIKEILTASDLSYREYLENLSRVVLTIVRHGSAVIVGRATHRVIPQRSRLAVRLVAPLERRIQRHMELTGVNEKTAAQEVALADAERHSFAKKHFQVDDEDPLLYDMVINTGQLGFPTVADLIVTAFHDRFGAR